METSTALAVELNLENAPASEPINSRTRMDFQMWLRGGCLASLQALSGSETELLTSVGSGPTPSESLEIYSRDSAYWKIPGRFSLFTEDQPSVEYSENFPASGMMCNGTVFPLPRLVRDIGGSASGFWLPTPIARDWKDTPGMSRTGTNPDASVRKREDTLPRAIYAREGSLAGSGIVNPQFSLWLMGFPDGWLEIN